MNVGGYPPGRPIAIDFESFATEFARVAPGSETKVADALEAVNRDQLVGRHIGT